MITVRITPAPSEEATCPKCHNKLGIRSAGPSLGGHRKYDVMSDTFGVCFCPACKHRAGWIEFHRPADTASVREERRF